MTTVSRIEIQPDDEKYNLPESYLTELYMMMKNITKYFKDNNIKYFADGGTLLGIMRDGGQIKHDNDIDFGMFENDFIKVMKYKNDIESKFDYVIQYKNYQLQIFSKLNPFCHGEYNINPCIDIFLYIKQNHIIKPFVNNWPNCFYKEDEFKPLIKRKYHDIDVYTVNKPLGYLNRYYGDWETKVVDVKRYDL